MFCCANGLIIIFIESFVCFEPTRLFKSDFHETKILKDHNNCFQFLSSAITVTIADAVTLSSSVMGQACVTWASQVTTIPA